MVNKNQLIRVSPETKEILNNMKKDGPYPDYDSIIKSVISTSPAPEIEHHRNLLKRHRVS